MIIALVLALPWWQSIPAYFIIGVAWALAYLPRSIALQARAYKEFRDAWTGNRPLAGEFEAGAAGRDSCSSPEFFVAQRDARMFTERRILIGFMVNIAFWPLRVLEKLVYELRHTIFTWLCDVLADVWNKLIVPLCRALARSLRYIWNNILGPLHTWAYLRVVTVYKTIIQRANREAIADLAVLHKTSNARGAK